MGKLLVGNIKGPAASNVGLAASGDSSGAADTVAIQNLLNLAGVATLGAGRFWTNSILTIPAGGRLTGASRYLTIIEQANAANLDAVVADAGWMSTSGTPTADNPVSVDNISINGNKANQTSGLGIGLALTTFWNNVRDIQVLDTPGDGIRPSAYTRAGNKITGSGVENHIFRCDVRNAGGYGIRVYDLTPSSGQQTTDGWIVDCIIQDPALDGIRVDDSAGWSVRGNHLYGCPQNAIHMGRASGTRVTGNYIETWGTSSTSGIYSAVSFGDGTNTFIGDSHPSIIHGNTAFNNGGQVGGTLLTGIRFAVSSGITANLAITGNTLLSDGFFNAIQGSHQNSASVSNVQLSGNQCTGWVKNWVPPGVGTCNATMGTTSPYDVVAVFNADPTGAIDASASFNNARLALPSSGGAIHVPAGIYLINSTVGPFVTGQWIKCEPGVQFIFTGTGDCFNFTDSSTYTTRTQQGGGIQGRPRITKTGSAAGARAIHAGDILGLRFDIAIQDFNGSTDIAAYFDNRVYWAEQAVCSIWTDNCTQDLVFDCTGATTSAGSFDRGKFTVYLSHKTFIGDCITWQNGAYQVGGKLSVFGNIASSASTFTHSIFKITGTAPAGHPSGPSLLDQIELNVNLESDGAQAHTFQTINYGSIANVITRASGNVSFGPGNQFTQSNITTVTTQFGFIGPVAGDTSLNENVLTGRLAVSSSASFFSNQYMAGIGASPGTPSGGVYTYVDLAGNLHLVTPNGVDTILGAAAGNASTGGSTDATSALSAAITAGAGGTVKLPPGIFLLNSSTALTLATAGTRLVGSGENSTILKIGSSFSASQAISITADRCGVSDLSIVGTSTTVTSNPVADGIVFVGQQGTKIKDVFFQYVNGWMIDGQGGSSRASVDTMIRGITGRNCAAGVRCLGVTGSSFLGEYFISDLQLQQMGAASGGRANLDAFLVQDISDILVSNVNIGLASSQIGSAIHVNGACATVKMTNVDVGANAIAGAPAAILIDSGTNGSPADVSIINGGAEGGVAVCRVDAGNDIVLTNLRLHQAYSTGLVINGGDVRALACSMNANNQSGGTGYDIDTSGMSSGNATFVNCQTESAVAAATAGSVTNPVNTSTHAYYDNCHFIGGATAPSNVFNGTPQRAINNVGYNPRGSVTATTIGTSPFTPGGYQTPLMVIFTAINGMTDFAIGGVSVGLPTVGVPYPIGVRESMTITYTGTKPTWAWFGL